MLTKRVKSNNKIVDNMIRTKVYLITILKPNTCTKHPSSVYAAANAGDALGYRIDYLTKHQLPNKPAIPRLHLAISSLIMAFLTFIILTPLPTHLP